MKQLAKALAMMGAILGAVSACGPDFDHAELSGVKATELGGGLTMSKLDVPEGLVVKAHVVMWNDHNDPMELQIRAVDPSIVETAGVVSDRDYAFIGRKVGRTQVEFRAAGTLVLTVDAEVSPQPAQP